MQRLSRQQRDDDELARLLGFNLSELDERDRLNEPGDITVAGAGCDGATVAGAGCDEATADGTGCDEATADGTGQDGASLGDADTAGLLDAARRLASAREAPPTTAATEALVTALFEQIGHEPEPERLAPGAVSVDGVLALLLPQIRLLQARFWLATAVVLLGGIGLAAWIGAGSSSAALYLLMAAPLLTALGVSFAYYTGDRLFELEATWPITPEQVIWGRTLLVVGYDIVLAVIASAVLAVVSGSLPWLALVTTWLAPLFGLAAVSLLAATYLGPWQGTAVSTGLWALGLVAHVRGWTVWFTVDALAADVWLRAVITVALGLALWLSLRHVAGVTRRRWLRLGWSG